MPSVITAFRNSICQFAMSCVCFPRSTACSHEYKIRTRDKTGFQSISRHGRRLKWREFDRIGSPECIVLSLGWDGAGPRHLTGESRATAGQRYTMLIATSVSSEILILINSVCISIYSPRLDLPDGYREVGVLSAGKDIIIYFLWASGTL